MNIEKIISQIDKIEEGDCYYIHISICGKL